jgi:two-component system capsular synthesis response regulator RcsB
VTTGERHARVIVADDHSTVRIAMKQLLDSLPGVTVIAAAASGRQLLDALTRAGTDASNADLVAYSRDRGLT